MPRPASKVDWRRSDADVRPSSGRFVRRVIFTLVLATLAGVLIWLLLPPSYPQARFVSLPVTEYDIELPPITVFPGDIDRFEQSSYTGTFDRLDELQTSEAIGGLSGRLRGIVSGDDTLILYVAAHGVSENGVPYLLCSDFLRQDGADAQSQGDWGRYELAQFLARVVDCPAKLKLVILDVGHIASDPRLGMVVNEFPRLLAKEMEKIDDPSLWALTANRSLETTHVSHAMQRSIFSHYVSQGLGGDADKAGNEDGRIDLAELGRFVRSGVADWVSRETDRAQSQTPLLLKAGVGIVDEDDLTEPPFLLLASRDAGKDENAAGADGDNAQENDQAAQNRADADKAGGVHLASYAEPTAQTEPAESGSEEDDAQPPPGASAVDADDETSGAPLPAEGDSAGQPDNTPPADEPAPAVEPETVKPESADAKAADPKANDVRLRRLLDDAWAVRDRRQVRGSADPWSPVDYAPHLWREYQALLLGYELRYRRGAVLDEQKLAALEDLARGGDGASYVSRNTALGRLDDARSEFLRGDARRGFDQRPPGLEAVAEAVKLQNDLLFAAPYYVRWHACHVRVAGGDRALGQTLNSLLDELADLVDLLESLSLSTSQGVSASADPRRLLAELTERTERLQGLRDDVHGGHLEMEARDVLADPTKPRTTARIEALLSTPLAPGPLRTRLLDALGQIDQETPGSPKSTRPDRAQDDSLAARKPTWDALAEQSYLEAKLVLLADPGHQFSLSPRDFTRPRNHQDEEKLWGEYRLFGAELGAFYRRLPARILALVDRNIDVQQGQDAGRPQRLIRLVDARDVRRTLGRSLTSASLPEVDWPRLKMVRPVVEAPSTVTLVRDDWAPLEVTLEAIGGDAREASYRFEYNPAQLRLEDVDSGLTTARDRWRPASLGSAGRQTLHLRVRYEEQPRQFDPLLVHLRIDGEETTHEVALHLPSPNVVDLVVERITGTAASSAGQADRYATVLVDRPQADGAASVIRCRAFSNRSTEYRMALVNRSGRARKVVVELFTVQTRLGADPSSRPDPFDRFGRLASGFTRLADPLEVELPPDEALTPLPFPDPRAAEEGAPDSDGDTPATPQPPAADASAGSSADGPLVTHGILCLIRDEQSDGEWSRWIDFSPVAPREYLRADVYYSHARRRISIELAPLAGTRVLPPLGADDPIEVVWETEGVLPPGTRMKTVTRLTNAAHTADLDAVIDPDVTRSVEIRLSVSGYPRAFVFYEFPTNRDKPQAEINGDLRRVEIVSPAAGDAFRVPLESPLIALVRVDAPTDAFRKPGDVLEVGIDQNDDRSLGDDEKQEFTADRHVAIRLGRLDPGGIVEVFTLVRDFEIELDPAGLANTRVDIKADLRLDDRLEASAAVPIVLDGARPVFDRLIVPTRPVAPGAEVEVRAQLSDTSGVEVVQFGFDVNNSNVLDDDEKLEELFAANDGDAWRAVLPTEDLKPNRTYTLIVVAVDRVGLDTKERRPIAIDEAAMASPAGPDSPRNSTIRGRLYVTSPDERLPWTAPKVLIVENGRQVSADRTGAFTFDDLPPGTYTLQARGMAGNRILQGEKAVTLTEEEAQVLIRMERAKR